MRALTAVVAEPLQRRALPGRSRAMSSRPNIATWVLTVIAISASTPPAAAATAASKVVIAPVHAGGLVSDELAVELEEAVRAGVMRQAPALDLRVMSHATLTASLADLRQRPGVVVKLPCSDLGCDAAVGRMLDTRYAVSTRLTKLDGRYLALLKLVANADDRVLATGTIEGETFGAVLADADAVAAKLVGDALQTTPLAPAQAAQDAPLAPAPQAECRMGSNGRQACGFRCSMGSDGVMVCADTPNGTCAMGSDGHVVCTQLAGGGRAASASSAQPECHMSSRGRNTCGYNCRFGSNGNWYCASTPEGKCAFNSDGTWTCM